MSARKARLETRSATRTGGGGAEPRITYRPPCTGPENALDSRRDAYSRTVANAAKALTDREIEWVTLWMAGDDFWR